MSTSTSNLFSVKAKVALVSTSVLSAAIMLTTSDIAVYAPWIYNGVVSWLQPPYLYLVVNCIIITIVASSKLQPPSDDASAPPQQIAPPLTTSVPAAHQPAAVIVQSDFLNLAAEYNYGGDGVEKGSESDEIDSGGGGGVSEFSPPPIVRVADSAYGADDETSNKENEFVEAAKSTWTAAENSDAAKFERPPTSARFGHRRILKASPEGGRAVLGVSKPKKQDTLENTWKAITEGRAMPMSRHLKKSDTWERERSSQENTPPPPQLKAMRKAETFNDRSSSNNNNGGGGGGGQGKLRKEPSLSQDELNRRVEAFIKKFNEDMRLQRQESLNQYSEMVKR